MGATPMNNDGSRDTGLVEQNNDKGVNNIVECDVQESGSFEKDESRTDGVNGEINNGSDGAIQVLVGPQKPQPQRAVVHWERYLPTGSLKVLLVENDKSTRHVVSALLRNCSYEVTAVANGIQAWKILEDMSNHIDLILSEVVMPFLSGIGLLCKIMSHKTLKTTPMIMMSSHDSMGLVFKCLSKGAVDFLVKPIRKNELKNLWQHVWRRCLSSSGSWSESDTDTTKSVKSKSNDEFENNTASSYEHDNGHMRTTEHVMDNGSETQSSWMKRAAEGDNPQPLSTWDQLTDAPDSTCVIHTKPEGGCGSRWVRSNETKESLEQDEQLDKVAMGKDLEPGTSTDLGSLPENQDKFSTQPSSKRKIKLSELVSMSFKKEWIDIESENISSKVGDHGVNIIGAIGSGTDRPVGNRALESSSGLNMAQIRNKSGEDFRESPSMEFTSIRLDDRIVSRHPDLSAFSKYNTASSVHQQAPTGNIGSCSPLDNSSIAMMAETVLNSSQNDMASTTKYVSNPDVLNNKSGTILGFKCSESSAFKSVQKGQFCSQKLITMEEDVVVVTDQVHMRVSNQEVQVQHHHHHYHHHHHHVDNTHPDHDNVGQGLVEGKSGNYSVNGSASGSKHGSNGQNGTSNALNALLTNGESDSGAGVSVRDGGNGTDEDRFVQREAALIKFRQKRKERSFEKKVQYQNRKRLAEQRPRIRGQFVRNIGFFRPGIKDKQESVATEDISCDGVQ